MMDYGFGYMGGVGSIFMLIFWGLVVWGIIYLIRVGFGGDTGHHHNHRDGVHEKSSLDIIKERYAKGEINKSEFEEKKKDLQ